MAGRASPPVIERRLDGARLTLPQTARAALDRRAALSADLAGCVLLMPPGLWDEMLPLLQACSSRSHHAAELFRLLAASETSVPVDYRGRLTIPRLHMEWAGLSPDKPVIVVALGQIVEVWDPRRLAMRLRIANRNLRELNTSILREQLAFFEQPE